MSEVAERVQTAIRRKGYSQRAIAARLEISESYLSDIVNARRSVSAYVAVRLERVLGISAQWLLFAQASEELAATRAEYARQFTRGG